MQIAIQKVFPLVPPAFLRFLQCKDFSNFFFHFLESLDHLWWTEIAHGLWHKKLSSSVTFHQNGICCMHSVLFWKEELSQGLSPRSSTLSCLESRERNLQESHHHWGLFATELCQTRAPYQTLPAGASGPPYSTFTPHPLSTLLGKLIRKHQMLPDLAPAGHLDHTTSVPCIKKLSPPTIKEPQASLFPFLSHAIFEPA